MLAWMATQQTFNSDEGMAEPEQFTVTSCHVQNQTIQTEQIQTKTKETKHAQYKKQKQIFKIKNI